MGFDHLGDQGGRATLHLLHEFADAGQAAICGDSGRQNGFRSDIACLADRSRPGMILKKLYADTHRSGGVTGALSRASGKDLDCRFHQLDQADFLELRG